MFYSQQPFVQGTISLRCFLLTPHVFVQYTLLPMEQFLSLKEQQSYLIAVFKQQQDTPRPILRKTPNEILEVHEGWQYVDTLIRFFQNRIPMPYEINNPFSDAFDNVCIDMNAITTSKSIGIEDFYYSNLQRSKKFRKIIHTADVAVSFINVDDFNI